MRHLFLLASAGDLEGSTCDTGAALCWHRGEKKTTQVTLKDAWFFSRRRRVTSHYISDVITR